MKKETQLQSYINDELNANIRTVTINDEPYFVAKDVCDSLGYFDYKQAIRDNVHIDDIYKVDARRGCLLDTLVKDSKGRRNHFTLINESGIYSLILKSRMPSAIPFQRWVTKEVIPSIRKTGYYITEELKKQLEQQTKLIEEQKQELERAVVLDDEYLITIRTLANIITELTGIKIGQQKLFKYLRDNGYLQSCKTHRNEPYQKYIENNYFRVTRNKLGRIITLCTNIGREYFISKFYKMTTPKYICLPLF